jgi:tRNA (adenine22-N1)-methyltransferase
VEAALKLSPRLQLVADQVLADRGIADVGTDHALLSAALVQRGRVPFAIASDVSDGPLARARTTLASWPDLAVELRTGSGLTVLRPGEVATCVLAGMGGPLARRLVDRSPEIVRTLTRLVLQPNTDWPGTRRWIAMHRWTLVDERMVHDAGHHYLVLVVDPCTPASPRFSEDDLELGPIARHRADPSWRAWLRDHRSRLERALTRARAALPEDDPRLRALERRLELTASNARSH